MANPTGDVLIEMKGITKHYGRIQALTDVSLTIREGEMRADVPAPGIDREDFLSQAPVREGNQVLVAPVLNAEG